MSGSSGLRRLLALGAVSTSALVSVVLGPLISSVGGGQIGTALAAPVAGQSIGAVLSLSGAGSPGLSINSTSGIISGTPTAFGSVDVTETNGASQRTTTNVLRIIQPDTPTTNFLAAMGATQGDWDAIKLKGLKELGPSGFIVGRAIDPGRVNNERGDNNFVSSFILKRDFNAVVYENQFKPSYETVQGSLTTVGISPGGPNSVGYPYESIDVMLARLAPDMLKNRAFHLGAGWNSYLPTSSTWTTGAPGGISLAQKLADDPAYMKTYLDNRVGQIAAYYAARPGEAEKVHRADVVNEVTNGSSLSVAADDDGWRLHEEANAAKWNSLRKASKTAAGLEAYGAGNTDSEKWIQRLFEQFRVIFPNADLCMVDFGTEQVQVANDLTPTRISYTYTPAANGVAESVAQTFMVYSDNGGQTQRFRLERLKGEIHRYKRAGIPVTGVGYQMHTDARAAVSDIDLEASLWDWNRWGIRVSMTEINAEMGNPGNLPASDLETIYRYNAVAHAHVAEIILNGTNCREITTWTAKSADGQRDIQPASNRDRDFPLRTALALVLARAKPVELRDIKRGHHWTFRARHSQNYEWTGTQSFSDGKMAITAAGNYVRKAWHWFNDPTDAMPIIAETMIIRAQFCLVGNFPTAGSVIEGEFSADGLNGIALVGKLVAVTTTVNGTTTTTNVNKLFVRQRLNGVNTDTEVPNVVMKTVPSSAPTLQHAAYIAMSADRSVVKVGYGTLDIAVDKPTGVVTVTGPLQNAEETLTLPAPQPIKTDGYIYACSDPQTSAYNGGLRMTIAAIYHGPDYGTTAKRQALSLPYRQEAWVPRIGADWYLGT